jgi:hypothetical protein
MPQQDNPHLARHLARTALRQKLRTVAGTATAAQLRDLLNLLLADMGLDDPEIGVDVAALPADVRQDYVQARKPKPTKDGPAA